MSSQLLKNFDQDQSGQRIEFNYHLLRSALNRYGKNLQQLNDAEQEQVQQLAIKSFDLESRVLNSPEARSYIVNGQLLEQSIDEIKQRYASVEEFESDMQSNGLDETTLRLALHRELTFDGVMQLVGSKSTDVSDLDVRIFYEMHPQRFEAPEKRLVRHILITINEDYAENSRINALSRMNDLVEKLNDRVNRFPQFAKKYSECPTAMEGGKLGEFDRGHLYPEIDTVLFEMDENTISPIVETEIGFHLLWCEKITPGKSVPFNKVKPRIHELLTQRQQRQSQKTWLANLK